ncbi:uncharacterized protein DUF302 [Roseimicrobium gellanilyticum]|uniref:Uncharacterized protein DUF302 n=1 Tax=Roseimicrobium gellanilyticum TaxID=748857 RepID=A0A366HAK7_9BACT|nr:serine hydrolase [Roseimicrobium gellanilyticum]RBP38511.1 uncharacterized protein DUF302 [Roseimicrobium gellanilyticum]
MMKSKPWSLLLFGMVLLALLLPAHGQRGNPRVQFEGETIDEMIEQFMAEHQVPGMTLAIVQAPYIPRAVGYGMSDVSRELLASPNTLWNIGQMTRAFTAVAIVQLLEDGRLKLEEPVGKFVTELPPAWQGITLRQLMAHASGLPDYTQQKDFDPAREYRPADIIALIKNQPSVFQTGAKAADSATDFFLLALVIEKASGMSYEEFVTKHQIERLGLKNTMFASDFAKVKREAVEKNEMRHKQFLSERPYIDPTEVAVGHAEIEGKIVPLKQNSQSAWLGSGSVFASATDISLWDVGLAGGLLIKEKEHRALIYGPSKLNDGSVLPANCGWRFPAHKGLMDIEGHVPGYSTYLSRFTDKSELVCVTLCANKSGVDLSGLARKIAGAYNRKLGPPVGATLMKCRESCYPVKVTMDRLESFLREREVGVVARVDHAAAAKAKGLELPPTEVIIFGDPTMGTHLMHSQRSIAVDLPLRVMVWQEADGTVWTGHHEVSALAEEHGIKDQERVVKAMNARLEAALRFATAPY